MDTEVEAAIFATLEEGDHHRAAELILRAYGDQILGFLVRSQGDETEALEIWSIFTEDLWKGLPGFQARSSARTWAYQLARHARSRFTRDAWRSRSQPLKTHDLDGLIQQVRTRTLTYLRDEARTALEDLRAELSPEERELLVLRIDQGMSWDEVAGIMAVEGSTARSRARLRARFTRLVKRIRKRAEELGMLP
jgi:RNA polymerase sigma-70 factor, ECF subfamily